MKTGIFIYQDPVSFGQNPIVAPESLGASLFTGINKADKFIEELNKEFTKLNDTVTVVKDDTEANLEEIASRNYDFIICVPGLQNKMYSKDKLPPIFYLESLEYHNLLISKTFDNIQASIL